MNKKYIISGMLGTLLLGFTTVFALNITNPTPTNPIFKAVYIWWSSAGTQCSGGKPSCVGTNSTICMDGCGGLYLNVNVAWSNTPRYSPYWYGYSANGVWWFGYEANNFWYSYWYNDAWVFGYGDGYRTKYNVENILKWNPTNKIVSVGKLLTEDLPDNIITATHILDRSVLTRKFNSENITLPTIGWMIKSNNTCWTNETAVGISWWNMVCVPVSFLNTQNFLPNCWSGGGSYSLFASGIQYVSGWQTVYGYRRACKSNVINVLGADGGDMNWSGSTTWNIWNKNIGNVWVGLTNPSQKLTVQDSLNVNGMGEKILCMRTDEYVDIDTYSEDDCAKCPAWFSYNTTTKVCEKGCAMCAGTWWFPNATLCTGDDAYVPAGSSYSLIGGGPEACINNSNKCKYFCDPGFIKVGEECLKCQEGTYTTWSNACILEAKCDNAAYDSILTGTAGVGSGIYTVCALRGTCYAGYNPSQWVFVWWPTLFPVYNNTTRERVVIKEPFLPKNLWKAARKYIANSGDMLPNSCHYTCAEGYYLSTDGVTCEPPICEQNYKSSGTGFGWGAWWASALWVVLSWTTEHINYWKFLDATDRADFYNKINRKEIPEPGCFFWCANPITWSDWIKSCPPTTPDEITSSCVRRNTDWRREVTVYKPSTTNEKRQYTWYAVWDWNYPNSNNIPSGCWYSCNESAWAITWKLANYSPIVCIPKCDMTTEYLYVGDSYAVCDSCNTNWIGTGPIIQNGNNSRCIYKCAADEVIYNDYYNLWCETCPADKMPGGNKTPNWNYTVCIPKCDYDYGLYYDLVTNSCLPANTTGTCPSWFDEKTIEWVKKCVRCPSSNYHWDEWVKACVLN